MSKKYFCDICGTEIDMAQALGGHYFKARISSPMEVEIHITAERPVPAHSEKHPELEICAGCVFDAVRELSKKYQTMPA